MRIETKTETGTKKLAKYLVQKLMREKRDPLVFALSGNLGAGKTVFAKGLANALGVRDKIQSPTFVLAKWYDLEKRYPPYKTLIHIDAYRLESLKGAERLGFSKLFRNRGTIIVIEWADRIKKLIPKGAVWIEFKHGSQNQRRIRIPNY